MNHTTNSPWPARLQNVAFFLLLACVAARPFMSEMMFEEMSALKGFRMDSASEQSPPDRNDLSRTTFAILTFVAGGLWALGRGLGRGKACGAGVSSSTAVDQHLRHRWLGGLILAFILASFVTVFFASNHRIALVGWLEQSAFMLAGYMALHLCVVRWRFILVLALLAALGVTMAGKGLWDFFVEAPARVQQWQDQGSQLLAAQGIVEGSPNAIAMEHRWLDPAPLGFTALSNVFASVLLLVIMGVLGLGLALLGQARACRAAFLKTRKKGEIHAPTVVAAAVLALVVPLAAVLAMTRSRGGLVCTGLAVAVLPAMWRYRRALAWRWKRALLVTAAVLAIMLASVVVYGMRHEGLPVKTLTFRWLYWTASMEIVKAHPLTGVGWGNFGSAYLPVRDVRGEEAVRNPHNLIVHSLAEQGIPAGTLYLAVIGGFLVVMARPRAGRDATRIAGAPPPTPSLGDPLPRIRLVMLLLAVLPAIVMARAYFSVSAPAIFDVIPWTFLTCLALIAAFFAARPLASPDADLSIARMALALGAIAFVFHEMINFCLFQPATAALFWLVAGAAGGMGAACGAGISPASSSSMAVPSSKPSIGGLLLAGLLLTAAIVAVPLVWWPIYHRSDLTDQMLHALRAHRDQDALSLASQACQADTLDPVPADDAARLFDMFARGQGRALSTHEQALEFADQAIARDPQSAKYWMLRATISTDQASQLADMEHVIRLDPQNARRHMEYAQMLWSAKFPDLAGARAQLREVHRINDGLFADSNERLNPAEQANLNAMDAAADLGARAEETHNPHLHLQAAKLLEEVGLDALARLHMRRARSE